MQINTQLAKAFNRAVTTAENIDTDGSINWNFVDADVHIAVKEADLGELHFDLHDFTAGCYQEFIEFGEIDDNMADQAA